MVDGAMTTGRIAAGLVLLVAAGCHHSGSQRQEASSDTSTRAQTVTGTVQHVEVEGGFYGIVADDGTKLDPVNLPDDFRKDGVRVRVRVVEVKDAVSTHMWGKLVRILAIERLPSAKGQ